MCQEFLRRYKLPTEDGYSACAGYSLCGVCDECLRDKQTLEYWTYKCLTKSNASSTE